LKGKTHFIFFTKTNWSEPPRMRHQLANLLLSAGHRVTVYGRPRAPWANPQKCRLHNRLNIIYCRELFHHQLRVIPLLHRVNTYYMQFELVRTGILKSIDDDMIIINFNYDYYFLRTMFPRQKIVTIINDDFEAVSKFPSPSHIAWALEQTCRMSNKVLAVSFPLQERLASWCNPEIFLPWTETPYILPTRKTARNTLLYWGYVDKKLDFDFVYNIASKVAKVGLNWRFLFVGPQHQSVKGSIAKLSELHNITFQDTTTLNSLPLDKIFCSIIPYWKYERSVPAISLPNKSVQLLARGLPLLVSGMPNFIRRSFIFQINEKDFVEKVEMCRMNFWYLQPKIKDFVKLNSPLARLSQLLNY